MRHYCWSVVVVLLSTCSLKAQVPDSISDLRFLMDSTRLVAQDSTINALSQKSRKSRKGIKIFFLDGYPNPKKAALFSFVVPGLGQAYNGKFWKVPIVYTAVGTTIYLIGKNGREYRRYRDAYRLRVDGDDDTVDEFEGIYTQSDRIKGIRDDFRKKREQSYIGLVAALALSAADAFVDAHLKQFNVTDDLSLQVKPTLTPVASQTLAMGIGVGFRFHN